MIVRKLRLQRGWSQDQLAELTGLSVRTVQRLERGQKPSLESARSLASVFEVDISTFNSEPSISEENDMPDKIELQADEETVINQVKSIKEFCQGIVAYAICAVVFFILFGFDKPVLYWVFGGVGIGLLLQGLFAFEVIRVPFTTDWEKKMIEKKLGRKL